MALSLRRSKPLAREMAPSASLSAPPPRTAPLPTHSAPSRTALVPHAALMPRTAASLTNAPSICIPSAAAQRSTGRDLAIHEAAGACSTIPLGRGARICAARSSARRAAGPGLPAGFRGRGLVRVHGILPTLLASVGSQRGQMLFRSKNYDNPSSQWLRREAEQQRLHFQLLPLWQFHPRQRLHTVPQRQIFCQRELPRQQLLPRLHRRPRMLLCRDIRTHR